MSSTKLRNVGLIAAGVFAGVLISLGVTAVAQRPGTGPLPLDELRQFSSVFAIIKNNYVEPIEDRQLLNGAIAGMVSDLDPHSAYLDADAFREMQTVTQGEFGGLGIEVGTRDGFVSVISPIEDTPAARAGVRAGDLIVRIDDTATQGMALQDAVKLMRGKPQTPIVLTLMREGESKPIVVELMRDIIQVRSVRSQEVEPGVGYVRISQFQERTGADLARHLAELGKNGAPKFLVLDLRNDPGGLLNGAIGVAGAFLPPGAEVVSTKGRTPDSNQQYHATPADYLRGGPDYLANLPGWVKTVPMVVLVNGGSASASEIVAGALQDHGRAQVLGTRTFGKGSVQVILPISRETAIKLTTSRYYTPKGRSIQATGIEPDYLVAETANGDLFERPREADLTRHLSNDQNLPEIKSTLSSNQSVMRELPKPIEFGGPDDYQLQQALNLLHGRPVTQSAAAGLPRPGTDLADTMPDASTAGEGGSRMKVRPGAADVLEIEVPADKVPPAVVPPAQ